MHPSLQFWGRVDAGVDVVMGAYEVDDLAAGRGGSEPQVLTGWLNLQHIIQKGYYVSRHS